ncbi:MAG: CinA family protein [Microbacteriaceae bacterium]
MTETEATDILEALAARGLTIAVAESLTGGMLVSELVNVPGASASVLGGIVAYNTHLKSTFLDVDPAMLAVHGVVHPDVARAMAVGVRHALAVDGLDADIGIATTGVAGPETQDGAAVGTVYIALSTVEETRVVELHLDGDRQAIRKAVVSESLVMLREYVRIISAA